LVPTHHQPPATNPPLRRRLRQSVQCLYCTCVLFVPAASTVATAPHRYSTYRRASSRYSASRSIPSSSFVPHRVCLPSPALLRCSCRHRLCQPFSCCLSLCFRAVWVGDPTGQWFPARAGTGQSCSSRTWVLSGTLPRHGTCMYSTKLLDRISPSLPSPSQGVMDAVRVAWLSLDTDPGAPQALARDKELISRITR
jgi:hypothetical protein